MHNRATHSFSGLPPFARREIGGLRGVGFLFFLLSIFASFTFAQSASRSVFFVENEGQWPGEFAFRFDGGGGSWFVTDQGMTIDLKQYEVSPKNGLPFGGTEGGYFDERENAKPTRIKGHVLKANLVSGDRGTNIAGKDKLSSYSNYFFGKDKSNWRSRVGHYSKVIAKEIWPGIDVEYEAKKEGVETFFRIQPGADVSQIQIEYEGLEAPLSLDSKGNLVLKTSLGSLIEKAPFAYQIENRRQREVPVQFVLTSDNSYRLSVESYRQGRELVIDPLIYSTFFAPGSVNDMCRDFSGNMILVGAAYNGHPTTQGAYQEVYLGQLDGYVSKFSPNGQELLFSTYIGSPVRESIYACVNDLQNRIHVGGYSHGAYPLTEDAYDRSHEGSNEATYSILSEDGTELLYSTYLGGRYEDFTSSMKLDSISGEVYALGTISPGFPTTQNAIYTESVGSGGMIVVINPEIQEVVYATYFPTSVEWSRIWIHPGEVVDYRRLWFGGRAEPAHNAPVFPITDDAFQSTNEFPEYREGFFAKLDLENNVLEYSSYFGASGDDQINDLKVITENRILLAGHTQRHFPGYEFPLSEDAFDTTIGFVKGYASIIELPNQLLHSSFIGGECQSYIADIDVSISNSIIIVGSTNCDDFPITPNAYDSTPGVVTCGSDRDIFVVQLSQTLSELKYGTYIARDGSEFPSGVVKLAGDTLWLTGSSTSSDFPITEDAFLSVIPDLRSSYLLQFMIPETESTRLSQSIVPSSLILEVFPNPFNPSTTISFNLPRRAETSLEIFNLLGRSVYSIDLGRLEAGQHQHHLNATSLPSGSYLTRLDAGDMQDTKKMVLVR